MSRFRLSYFAALALLAASGTVFADFVATAEIRGPGADPHRITIPYSNTDTSFSFDVFLTTNFDATGVQMRIQTQDADGNPSPQSGVIQLTSSTFDGNGIVGPGGTGWGYYGLGFSTPDTMSGSPGLATSQLIGCLTWGDQVAAGESRLMTVDGKVLAGAAAGIYRLNLDGIVLGDTDSNDVIGTAGMHYEIEILSIPAPAALPLGLIGLAMVGWCRKRLLAS